MTSPLTTALCAAALTLCAGAAGAQGYGGYEGGYGPPPGLSAGASYAGPLLAGDYVGAPLTRFPRPTELVPSAWGYGTYGVPTVTGIRQAPAGTPTLIVIDAPAPAARRSGAARSRILSRGRDAVWRDGAGRPAARLSDAGARLDAPRTAGAARIVTVSVPRR